jgi:hypothetical protein
MTLCYIDTETTGLDPRIHQPWEVCTWLDGAELPETLALPHTLEFADAQALKVGGWWERRGQARRVADLGLLANRLRGVTLVGSNPAFDAAMLTRVIGAPVWHHRMIDVSNVAMVVLDTDRPLGLAACADACRERGHEIPEPDHTAEGDVRTTRAVYEALREMGRS